MGIKYKLLTDDEKNDTMAAFLHSQERDHHSHTINLARFTAMLVDLPEGPFRERIKHLKAETEMRLQEVEAIITNSEFQMPSTDDLTAAMGRLKARDAKR